MRAKRCPSCGHALPDSMGITVDAERQIVMRHGKAVRLSPKRFAAFLCLYERRGRIVTYDYFKSFVWGERHPKYQTLFAFLTELRTMLIPLLLRIECEMEIGLELVVAKPGRRFVCTRRR